MSMNSMSAGMRLPQALLEAELVDEDDLDVAALRVEFLHALVIGGLAAGQVRQAFAMDDRPVIVLLQCARMSSPRRPGTSVLKVNSTAVSLRARSSCSTCSSTRRSRHSPLDGHQPRHVGEDVIRLIFQQCFAVLAQLVAAAHFFVDADLPAGHAVVGHLHVDAAKSGPRKRISFSV